MAEKNLYIISGCNGAGKTTASYSVLPKLLDCKQFVNADEIAKGLSPFCPESVAIQAGKLMLQRIEELLSANETFSIETTLATKSYAGLVKRAQAKGYKVTMLYFWLNSPELAVLRVARRVSEGGHNIPTDVIYRRYENGIKNLLNIFIPLVDSWLIVDNGVEPREIIAKGTKNNIKLFNEVKFQKINDYGRK